jgi:hypothetical protein
MSQQRQRTRKSSYGCVIQTIRRDPLELHLSLERIRLALRAKLYMKKIGNARLQ